MRFYFMDDYRVYDRLLESAGVASPEAAKVDNNLITEIIKGRAKKYRKKNKE